MDLINSLFVSSASLFIGLNILQVYRDKQVKGVSIFAVAFFTLWSVWNIYFFHGLGQSLSFYSAVATSLAHIVYISMLTVYYTRKE